MRLDSYLTEHEYYESRTRARRAVEEGCVSVNGKLVRKPAFEVSETDRIEAAADPVPYVSRGAFKLAYALEQFRIDLSRAAVALDVGASSGGFTEIMLKFGVKTVYAADVGKGQLAEKLRADPRVVNMEETDVRSLPEKGFLHFFDFVACDASFISLTHILPSCAAVMKPGACGVFLIKPQFEVGKKNVGKGGIVKDKKAVEEAILRVTECAEACGFHLEAPVVPSPITGGDGNREFLIYLRTET